MTLFDLLFAVVFLASVLALLAAGVAAARSRRRRALGILGGWAAGFGIYLAAVIAVSLASPRRVVPLREPQCFDDWCISVDRVEASPEDAEVLYTVDLLLHSRARGRAQREKGVRVYVLDGLGRRFEAEPDPGAVPLDLLLGPGESAVATRRFRLPADAPTPGLVVAHGRFPGLFIAGDDQSLFHAPSVVQFPEATLPPAEPEATRVEPAARTQPGLLYGRVTTRSGAVHEGRLRFGGRQEAFWSDLFNGARRENAWAAFVPPDRRPRESSSVEVFGLQILRRERRLDLSRPFVARFGDLVRIELEGRTVHALLKSGTVVDLDLYGASDFDDGVRVWDGAGEAVDLDSGEIRAIEFLPTPWTGEGLTRLHGRVRTAAGELSGFVQWNREKGLGSDELAGRAAGERVSFRFDEVRAIARREGGGARVTLADGREVELEGGDVGERFRGVFVDDPRYGRLLVSPEAFERVDFDEAGVRDSGPAYGDFPAGRPLAGRVTTRDGRRLAGRLVYDLDESETTDTLDAPAAGIEYTIPFGLVAAIAPPAADAVAGARTRVTLASGESLELEPEGDLGARNAGLLVFVEGAERPEYLPWSAVERIELAP